MVRESEARLYSVHHKDGTLSFIGDTKNINKNQPFAFRNASTPLNEGDLINKLQEAALPLKYERREVLGWGGDSVCFRISDGNAHFVGVLRSNREPENYEGLKQHWNREQEINQVFAPYSTRQHLVIVNGIDNHPAVLKVTPEVRGAQLSEISGMYLFVNKKLMNQYVDIMGRNLKRFFSSGIIADPIGHIKTSKLRTIFERYGLFLFDTSNLMIDFERNSLIVVDCEADDIAKQPPHRKLQLLSRALGMGVNIALIDLFLGLNYIRDKAFSLPSSKHEVDKIPEIEQFREGFSNAIGKLNASRLDYRVVGSFATAANINSVGGNYYLAPYRRDRTIRDVDVFIVDRDLEKAKKIAEEFNQQRQEKPYYPQINLSLPQLLEENKGYSEDKPVILPVVVTKTAFDKSGNFYLVYNHANVQLPLDYLEPVYQSYEGADFPTLKLGVLAGFYLTRMGVFKSKDIEKVALLLGLTNAQIPSEFLDFSKTLRREWPILYRNFLVRELMYHFSGGLIRKGIISSIKSTLKQSVSQVNHIQNET